MSARDVIFAVLAIVACFLFAALGLWGGFSIGYTISAIFTNILFTIYFIGKEHKISVFGVICEIIALLLAVNFAITTNGSVKFWSFAFGIILSVVWFDLLATGRKEIGDLGLVKNVVMSTVGTAVPNMPRAVASVFTYGKGKHKTAAKIIIGAACAIPALCVIIPLLAKGDAAFGGLVKRLFGNVGITLVQLFVTGIIAPFAIAYIIALKKEKPEEFGEESEKSLDRAFVIPFLSMISVCYILYIFSQFAYFFSAFAGILPAGYKFVVSEYARRGFFEMCVITAINLIIIFAALLVSKKKNGVADLATRILCLFIGLVTLTIAATALSKMVLYVKSFGMTGLRITTSAFEIFLIVVVLATIVRCFTKHSPVLRIALVTAGVILAVLGFANVNRIVADYNYNAYKSGKLEGIDVDTIADMGDEGVPYLIKLADDADEVVAEAAKIYLNNMILERYDDEAEGAVHYYKGFKEFNFPRNRAYKLLDEYIKENGIKPKDLYWL